MIYFSFINGWRDYDGLFDRSEEYLDALEKHTRDQMSFNRGTPALYEKLSMVVGEKERRVKACEKKIEKKLFFAIMLSILDKLNRIELLIGQGIESNSYHQRDIAELISDLNYEMKNNVDNNHQLVKLVDEMKNKDGQEMLYYVSEIKDKLSEM